MTDWKRKLAAYLHDPPSKALDIRTHGERSDAAFRQAGFTDETEIGEYFAHADHTGAAADRLPFPKSQTAGLQCAFDGVRNAFIHPLNGGKLPFHAEFKSAEQGIEGESSVQPRLTDECLDALPDDDDRWRARFFAHWRLWPKHASDKDYRLALLPADTRIPDHSIWTHMQVVSALAGCVNPNKQWQPAFLKFQLGPVQEFIAAARSIRDLWSGSYLLSWLMAAGMKALSEQIGPDAVIYPNLRGQPLFDLHWCKDLWGKVSISGQQSVWDSLAWNNRDLLTPNLPNVFLAVVPADRAADLGKLVCEAVQDEWKRIAKELWIACEQAGLTADEGGISGHDRKARFESQIGRFLSLSWQATAWPDTLDGALNLANGFDQEMPIQQARERIQAVVDMATKQMPVEHRDRRYYTDDSKSQLNNIGLGWSVILGYNGWQLDAVRQTRNFDAANTGGWTTGTFNNKDALTGRDEAVAGGEVWSKRANAAQGFWPSLFKKADWVSASTLVKRVWHRAYLQKVWHLETDSHGFPMPNTRGIAAHAPEADCGDDETAEDAPPTEKYFAVIAFDGDEIGKWISGEKTPRFSSQLAEYTDGSGNPSGAMEYFTRESNPDGQGRLFDRFADFLDSERPLSPSYHLQFSEALSNFALLCARPIVEVFDGRLIYAGGDDVVALLPADTALACAEALRLAFTGSDGLGGFLKENAARLQDRNQKAKREVPWAQRIAANGNLLSVASTIRDGKTVPHPGFLVRLDDRERPADKRHLADVEGRPIPILVPGPGADASVGIAIAHFKTSLQDVVRAAQTAEKRAKRKPSSGGLDRKAVAVTLMKRSGEILEWGAKWDGGLELYKGLANALEQEQISAKFPHRWAELLDAYVTGTAPLVCTSDTIQLVADFPVDEIVRREFKHTLGRQRGPRFPRGKADAEEFQKRLNDGLLAYLQSLDAAGKTTPEDRLQSLIGLCQTVAFAHRTSPDDEPFVPPPALTLNAERQPA